MQHSVEHNDVFNIKIKRFGDVKLSDSFFDSFRYYYDPYYSHWTVIKADDPVFIVEKAGRPIAFMKLKIESETEDYSDIRPILRPGTRLKICSLKVEKWNYGLSIKMMDIAISEAIFKQVSEIYGTIPVNCDYKYELVNFLHKFGFKKVGIKNSRGIIEEVYSRPIFI